MYSKQFIAVAAVALGASMAVATTHGELVEANGVQYRYKQLANGFFTGIPVHEWDESIHIASHQEWDIDEIMAQTWHDHPKNGTEEGARGGARDLTHEARNLADTCQAVFTCIKDTSLLGLSATGDAWVAAAEYARNGEGAGKDLIDFINSPFVASAGGVAVAGMASGAFVNWLSKAKECSTASTDADVIRSAIAEFAAQYPNSSNSNIQLNGGSGSWSLTFNTGPEGTSPNPSC